MCSIASLLAERHEIKCESMTAFSDYMRKCSLRTFEAVYYDLRAEIFTSVK